MNIDEWAIAVMEALGVWGAGLLVALESLLPPIPSELILPLAGFTASRGAFELVPVIVVTTMGSIVGALALYFLGRAFGADRLAHIADRVPLMKGDDVRKAVVWFERWGTVAVLFGRFVPIVRSLVSIPAGVTRMNLTVFLLLTTLGSGIWNTVFVVLGFQLGENWTIVEDVASRYSRVVLIVGIVVALGIITWWIVRWCRSRRDSPSVIEASSE